MAGRAAEEQPPSLRMQRVRGRGEMGVHVAGGRTRLAGLFQEGAAKIRLPRRPDGTCEAVLINTAGGLTGGDRLDWRFDISAGASAQITTQACERIYRSAGGRAEITCRIAVGESGRVAWLPQETILFADSALVRHLDVELAPGGEALIVEATLFGRLAMGETVERAFFRDRWRIRAGGRQVHAEDFSIGPDVARALAGKAVADGAAAVAAVLFIGEDAAARLDGVRKLIGNGGGASFWKIGPTGKLLARLIAADGYSLRKRLVPVLELLNGQAALPKVWSI